MGCLSGGGARLVSGIRRAGATRSADVGSSGSAHAQTRECRRGSYILVLRGYYSKSYEVELLDGQHKMVT